MAKTTIPIELSSTPSIVDGGNATAITIDSSENVTFAGAVTSTGKITADAGIDIDNFNIDGTTLALSSGDMTIDVAGNIQLDADDNGEVRFLDGGTQFATIKKDGNNALFQSIVADGDFVIQGIDGSSFISAVSFDMSEAGRATFNEDVIAPGIYVGSRNASFDFYNNGTSYLNGAVTVDDILTTTNQVQAAPLGVSTPTYSFSGDTNTGMTRPTGDTLQFVCNGTAIVRIDSSDTMFGKASNDINTQGFHIISAGTYTGTCYSGITGATTSSTYHLRDTTNNTWKFYVTNAGVINATTTSITSLSDERLKENIKDLETGLTEIMSLKPRKFDWKKGQGSGAKDVTGFIAQEIETVFPDLIDNFMHDDLEDAKSVRMGDLIPTLVKAIQELKAEIEELKK
tara:strand:+ start:118 stop:1317 length:1200 start_codon:yes stop_codon:yes gene_type:complete